jgi:hypothetical protein
MKDIGIWTASSGCDGICIQSSDFTHDVMLILDGDFKDSEQKIKYAQHIVDRLNKTR